MSGLARRNRVGSVRIAFVAGVLLALAVAGPVHAQGVTTTLSAGVVRPLGDFADVAGDGHTVRAQFGLDLLLAGIHAQGGANRFAGRDGTDAELEFHAGVGGRMGLGLLWVGATAAWFSGDSDRKVGYLPEIGVGLGPLEVVADARLDGPRRWWGVRAGIRF